MKFLRTQQLDKSGGRKRLTSKPVSNACPEDLLEKVEKNKQFYFNLFVETGGDWAKVRVLEEKTVTTEIVGNRKRSWKYSFELDKMYGVAVADAFRQELFGHPEYYQDTLVCIKHESKRCMC